ncbi:MAG: hypothetical protein AAF682_23050 [Planctomycetota bacterium]
MTTLRNLCLSLAAILPTFGCASVSEVGCVIPPPIVAESDRETAFEIAAALEALPRGGELAASFQDAILIHFDRLSDPNACLFLFLKAIECYLDAGDVGRDIALELAGHVRVAWATRCGFRGAPLQLTDEERTYLDDSEYARFLAGPMDVIGIE